MKSNIILSLADFSANNIGRYAELSELTKAVLAKQTLYDEGSPEASAINLFLDELVGGGYIGGNNPILSVLMLPCLAGGRAECFYNIAALDTDGFPKDWKPTAWNPSDPEDNLYSLNSGKGVKCTAATGASADDGRGFKLNEGADFFSPGVKPAAFSLVSYLYADCITASNPYQRMIAGANSGLNLLLAGGKVNIARILAGNYITIELADAALMTKVDKGFYGMSYDPDADSVYINLNGTKNGTLSQEGTLLTTTNTSILNSNFTLISGNANDTARPYVSAVAFGKGMTQAQLDALKGHLDTLMNALNI